MPFGRTLCLVLLAALPGCGEVLGAHFEQQTENCDVEGEHRCADGQVCASGKWQPDPSDRFCHGQEVLACDGDSTRVLESCNGPCVGSGQCSDVLDVKAGSMTTCALLDDGSVWCWGDNTDGALGRDPETEWSATPAPVKGLSHATQLALGDGFGCALHDTGHVACWGSNLLGTLGVGVGEWFAEAREITSIQDAEALFADRETACARIKGGTALCWGRTEPPCLTGASDEFAAFYPVKVPLMDHATSLFATGSELCAPVEQGAVKCCYETDLPTPFPGNDALKNIVADAAGQAHVCVGDESGNVSCWGDNYRGQLCVGDMATHSKLVEISLPSLAELAGGFSSTYLLDQSGNVYCCGNNQNSECGLSGAKGEAFSLPVHVTSGALGITAGNQYACVLTSSHGVECWGWSDRGQTGTDLLLVDEPTPVVWRP